MCQGQQARRRAECRLQQHARSVWQPQQLSRKDDTASCRGATAAQRGDSLGQSIKMGPDKQGLTQIPAQDPRQHLACCCTSHEQATDTHLIIKMTMHRGHWLARHPNSSQPDSSPPRSTEEVEHSSQPDSSPPQSTKEVEYSSMGWAWTGLGGLGGEGCRDTLV